MDSLQRTGAAIASVRRECPLDFGPAVIGSGAKSVNRTAAPKPSWLEFFPCRPGYSTRDWMLMLHVGLQPSFV